MAGLDSETTPDGRTFPTAKERFYVIRRPTAQGAVVARFVGSGSNRVPQDLADHPDLVVTCPGSLNALQAKAVDQSGLTDEEKRIVSLAGYPTADS